MNGMFVTAYGGSPENIKLHCFYWLVMAISHLLHFRCRSAHCSDSVIHTDGSLCQREGSTQRVSSRTPATSAPSPQDRVLYGPMSTRSAGRKIISDK